MSWRSRVVSWVGVAAILAAAVMSARYTINRVGPWPRTAPWCPQDAVIYQWAADCWARGLAPWDLKPGTLFGSCSVNGPFLYPSWTLPPLHALLGPAAFPEHARTVVGVLVVAGVAQMVVWGLWARVNPLWVIVALAGITRFEDRMSIGAIPGNLEAVVALVLSVGALAWASGYRSVGPALMALAAAVKPDHAPWLLATAWAVGELRRGVVVLTALVVLVALSEPLVLGPQAFGWSQEVLLRVAHDDNSNGSTLAMLRGTPLGDAGALVWAVLAVLLLALVARAGQRLEARSVTRLVLAWLTVLLLLPRVKDYLWVTGYGPLLVACWIQPWALLAVPLGEWVRLQWPQYGVWAQTVVALGVLLATVQRPRQLAASLAPEALAPPQGSPQPGTFQGPPAVS